MGTHRLAPHPDFPPRSVRGVEVQWVETGNALRLRYRVDGHDKLVIPPFAGRGRADELWRTTCFELYIQPAECIDCGACEPVCPVDAIYPDRRLPAEQAEDKADNAAFFTEVLPGRDAPLGAPGGSMKNGEIGVDTPRIAAFVKPPEDD